MPSIFSKIVSSEIPRFKVAEDQHFLAFLDIFPLAKGHILVIPKKETDYIFDMDPKSTKICGLLHKKQPKRKSSLFHVNGSVLLLLD